MGVKSEFTELDAHEATAVSVPIVIPNNKPIVILTIEFKTDIQNDDLKTNEYSSNVTS